MILPPKGVDFYRSAFVYQASAKRLVTSLKYENNRALLSGLAMVMASLVPDSVRLNVDTVTWVPTTPTRRRLRGFDQSQLLARAIGRELVVPVRSLLARKAGLPQTGQGLSGRKLGPVMVPRGRMPSRVLLVDDVVTSGCTAHAAARALREGGAHFVALVTLARTPRRHEVWP